MKFGSLFAGIGGFDIALERAGMTCAFQVEIDKACRDVLARRCPDVPRFDDIRTVGRHNLPVVDLLCGGFPCQDLSVAGRHAGLAGQRSGLWWEFHRLIDELAPEWVLAENVPGLLSSGQRRDMGIVIGSLAELGYGVAWRVLDAQNFGVPQRRRRVFIVGHRGKPWSAPSEILFESESVCWDSPSRRTPTKDATFPPTVSTLQGGGKRGYRVDVEIAAGGGLGRLMTGADDNDAQGNRLVVMVNTRQDPIVGMQPLDADGYSLAILPALTASAGSNGFSPGYNRDELMIADDVNVRRLTPLECERLQGFPDGWTECQSDSTRYRQLGNAVAVPVVEWIARRMVRVAEGLNAEISAA